MELRPGAGWVEDELESGPLTEGEWWVADPVEGNINHCHGIPDWGVTATLVRDNSPTVTTVYLPLTDQLYAAVRGGGATLDGTALRTSTKTEFSGAMVGTGQARPGESAEDLREDRIVDDGDAESRPSSFERRSLPRCCSLT